MLPSHQKGGLSCCLSAPAHLCLSLLPPITPLFSRHHYPSAGDVSRSPWPLNTHTVTQNSSAKQRNIPAQVQTWDQTEHALGWRQSGEKQEENMQIERQTPCPEPLTSIVGSYSSTKWFWMSCIVKALFPTPPAPTTTSLYSVIFQLTPAQDFQEHHHLQGQTWSLC